MNDRAACAGQDPKYWFPTNGLDEDGFELEDYESEDAEKGKAICKNECPVFDWCKRKHAKEGYGIWYGTTPIERGMVDGKRVRRVMHS